MSHSPRPIHPASTLTQASIEVIELAASAHYGLRLRYVPETKPAKASSKVDKASPKPAKEPVKKPPPKVTSKPKEATSTRWPTTAETVGHVVEAILKRAGDPVGAEAFYEHLGPDKKSGQRVFEKFRAQLIKDGVIVSTGKNRGTRYSLPE